MNVAISIILLISYLAFVIYIMKGGNLLMGFIMMSCVWIPVGVLGGQIAGLPSTATSCRQRHPTSAATSC